MTKKYMSTIRDFSKGVQEHTAPNLIPENALVEAENAILGSGFVSKRNGYESRLWSPKGREGTWEDMGDKTWSDI